MSNFEHRIKEDSTEFEKAFLKIYDGSLWTALEKMKDWQPPKETVEVPQFVADWYEDRMVASFLSVVSAYSFSDDEDIKWVRDNGGLDLLCKMKLYGYTVEKEQLYHVVLPEAINCYLNFRTNNGDAMFGSSEEIGNYKTRFTEQEIKALDERYWQFAVPVDEVE